MGRWKAEREHALARSADGGGDGAALAALLAQAVLPAETQTLLLERAGGNPLYAEEFVRMLHDRGLLGRRGRTLTLPSDAEIPPPENVQALIAARLDTVPPERKALLHDAAVMGKVFWAGALAAMGDRDRQSVEQGLHELARKELVRPARTPSVEGETEYSFWPLLVRDVAYGQIPRAARAGKHKAAAEWVEQMAGERLEDHAELLAHHYREALELARASGDARLGDELEPTAERFVVLAGDRARPLDVRRASMYYQSALALASPERERGALLVKAADAAEALGVSRRQTD